VFTLQGYFARSDSLFSSPRIFCNFRQPSANFKSRNLLRTMLRLVFFFLWNIPFLSVLALDSKGIINTLVRNYVTMECADLVAFTFATREISWFRHARSDRHEFSCFCEVLFWVGANEVNFLAISSQRLQRSERWLNICKPGEEHVTNARITSLVGK